MKNLTLQYVQYVGMMMQVRIFIMEGEGVVAAEPSLEELFKVILLRLEWISIEYHIFIYIYIQLIPNIIILFNGTGV